MLADSQAEMAAGRALCLDCAKQFDAGIKYPYRHRVGKLFCSEMVSGRFGSGCPGDGRFGLYGRFIRRRPFFLEMPGLFKIFRGCKSSAGEIARLFGKITKVCLNVFAGEG
ncbi:MAG: hypothetical protein CM15mP62_33680 [Rhodospirillaceae bacterium]|nr:MAG: hypothetical protein CM15mP62_33680 [Rhodospirillaceae bacterium]